MSHIGRGDLHAYLDGALGDYPEEVAAGIREHLSACAECARLLEEERELRRNASEILAQSPEVPVDLTPFEELVGLAGQPAKPEDARASLSSRLRPLRLAATIVISLGAGWLARDLTRPAGRVESRVAAEVAPPLLDGSLRVEGEAEAGREVDKMDVLLEAVVPTDELFADTDEAPMGGGGKDEPASAVGPFGDRELRLRGGVANPARRQREVRSSTFDEDQVADARFRRAEAADAERLKADEPLASPSSALANVAQARGLVSGLEREYVGVQRSVDAQDALADDRSDAALDTSTPLLIPGLSVRDVRFVRRAGEPGTTVTVIQEMAGGRVVELRFVTVADGIFANRDAISEAVYRDTNEVSVDPLPDGWNEVVRSVPGGIATLRGPLSENELSRLLELAVAAR